MKLIQPAYIAILATSLLVACNSSSNKEDSDETSDPIVSVTPVGPVAIGRPDPTMFQDGALTEAFTEVDCTLSDGTETTCYRITIAGAPANRDTEGPYCPPHITSGPETAGSWFGENGAMVEVDGQWIENLSTLYNDDEWQMYNTITGDVHVQTGAVGCEIAGDPNPPTDLEFPSFCLECYLTDMGGGIERTILIPTIPVMTDSTTAINNHIGVSLNGVLFDREAPLELIESSHSLGMLDDCGAHANPLTGYHYHAATDCAEIGTQSDGHSAMVGIALDGFSIYANLDESGEGPGETDECNGQTDSVRGYHYHAQPGGLNQTISCWKGAIGSFEGDEDNGNTGGGGPPDFAAIAAALSANTGKNITETDLTDALVNTPPSCDDISGAAVTLGITEEELLVDLPLPPGLECSTETDPLAEGIDITMFKAGAFKVDPEIVDCTTNEGVETQCYQLTTNGAPGERAPGPFCPRNISDNNVDNVGAWFNVASLDGDDITLATGDLVDITGNFIASLSELYNDDNWQLYDQDTGVVRYTATVEACAGAARPDVEEQYQQNCIECEMAYLDDDFEVTYLIPVEPIPASEVEDRVASVGIALDGAELSGSAPVADILGHYTIAAFDDCGGHINLNQGYHYHATTGCTDTVNSTDGHAPLLGYAVDGYPIYAMKDEDGNEAEGLDECRGQTDDTRGYHYHAASASENRFIGCLSGQYISDGDEGGAGGGPPDFAAIAEALSTNTGQDISETDLTDALVNTPPSCDDISAAAVTLGITEEELLVDLPLPPGLDCS